MKRDRATICPDTRLILGVLALVCAACATPDSELPEKPNHAPQAALRVPVIAPLGAEVVLDASAATDREGDALTYVFEVMPEGSVQRSPVAVVTHIFTTVGVHSVTLRVIDVHGAESVAAQDIAVREDYPLTPDFCRVAEDCVAGDECKSGVCFVTGGAID